MQIAFQQAYDMCTTWNSNALVDHPQLYFLKVGSAMQNLDFDHLYFSKQWHYYYKELSKKSKCLNQMMQQRGKMEPLKPNAYFKIKKQTRLEFIDKYSEGELKTRKFVRVLLEVHYILTKMLPYQVYWDRELKLATTEAKDMHKCSCPEKEILYKFQLS